MDPELDEDAVAAYRLVGSLLLFFGAFVLAAALLAGPVLQMDLGFLTPSDMALISGVMALLGAYMSLGPGRPSA